MYSAPPEDQPKPHMPLTDNGIHLTEDGYWAAALCDQPATSVRIAAATSLVLGQDGKIKSEERPRFLMSKKPPAACDSR